MDDLSKLVDSFSHLLGAVAWPVAVVWITTRFADQIRAFLDRLSELKLKGLGFEATASKEKVEAALGAAEKSKGIVVTAAGNQPVSSAVSKVVTPGSLKVLQGIHILWVDDDPSNIFFERLAFESAGAVVTNVPDTAHALDATKARHYDVIISDMSRPPDKRAGYTLLEKLGDKHPPYVVYSSSVDSHHDTISKEKGAVGQVSSPAELFRMVVRGITENTRA